MNARRLVYCRCKAFVRNPANLEEVLSITINHFLGDWYSAALQKAIIGAPEAERPAILSSGR